MKKHVLIATTKAGYPERTCAVFATVEFKKGRLSICGVEGPMMRGDCRGSCGQCVDNEKYWNPVDGVDLAKFCAVWRRWHLNDLIPGTPAQMARLRQVRGETSEGYEADCKILEEWGQLVENGYKYGSAWLTEKVPEDVVEYLEALPDNSDVMPDCWKRDE